jgi:hypothetical protein
MRRGSIGRHSDQRTALTKEGQRWRWLIQILVRGGCWVLRASEMVSLEGEGLNEGFKVEKIARAGKKRLMRLNVLVVQLGVHVEERGTQYST